MKDTLTPEDKAALARFNLLHQYDPPPLREWMYLCFEERVWAHGAILAWCHWWMFSRVWRMVVKYGR